MNNEPNNHASEDSRFATDLDDGCAGLNPARTSDSLSVHGFLSLLGPDEARIVDARVRRAMAAVRAEVAAAERRPYQFRRVAAVLAAAAMVTITLIAIPMFNEREAYAALRSVVDTQKSLTSRSYELVIERGRDEANARSTKATLEIGRGGRYVVNLNEGCIGDAMSALSIGAPGHDHQGKGQFGKGKGGPQFPLQFGNGNAGPQQPGPLGNGNAGPQQPGPRMGGGGGGLPRLGDRGGCHGGPRRCSIPDSAAAIFGFDGESRWMIPPSGGVIRPDHRGQPAGEPNRPGDDGSLDILTLDSTLARLERGYIVKFVDAPTESRADGRPVVLVEATLKPGKSPMTSRIPGKVSITADAATFEVLRLEAAWDSSASPMQLRRVTFDLLGTNSRTDEFFGPASHERDAETDASL